MLGFEIQLDQESIAGGTLVTMIQIMIFWVIPFFMLFLVKKMINQIKVMKIQLFQVLSAHLLSNIEMLKPNLGLSA